jgi:hypothetical protein
MANNWSPSKEHKGPQHLTPEYLKDVLNGNKHIDGPKGDMSNRGHGSEDGAAFPLPPQSDKTGKNNGKSPWKKGK